MTSAFINKHKEYIIDQYVNEKKSTYEIALDLKTYPNKIRRTLNTLGVPLRDKSAAQTVAINSGRHEHPTRGKKRTESEKVAISNGMSNYWDEMDDKERQRRSELSKKQWAEMPEYEKANLRKLAAEELSKKDIVAIVQQTTPAKPPDGDWNPEEKISVQQVSFIDNKCRQLDINVLSFINSGDQRYGSIQDITKEKASSMLIILNKYQNGNMEIPEDIKVYDEIWRN